MKPLKSVSFEGLIGYIGKEFGEIAEHRVNKVKYEVGDCLMSGLAMMYFQHPSLLKYQERMKQKQGRSNLERLFGTSTVPSDTQMREILDRVEIAPIQEMLKKLFERVRRNGWAEHWVKEGQYLVVLDGTQYFSSEKIQCPNCLRRKTREGNIRYSHQVLPATIVRPGTHQILPLDVEQICNSDGEEKQDCEVNAAKRLIKRMRTQHPKLAMTLGGDDIYSREPMIKLCRENRYNYIFVAKPSSHKEMFNEIAQIEKLGGVSRGSYQEYQGKKRLTTRYRLASNVPLNGGGETSVNFLEIWQEDSQGKLLYHNSWVTDFEVTPEKVASLAQRGRARWKIENEGFNIQKNGGYELTHNYGHGKNNLAFIFYLLNILAFILHQILELTDALYLQAKAACGGLSFLWQELRVFFDRVVVDSWATLLKVCFSDQLYFDNS